MATTSQGFNLPAIGSNNWGTPLNFNFSLLDQMLSGARAIAALQVSGNVTVAGSITAGQFIGADGVFLTSGLYDQPNGIPQLDGTGKIPAGLLPGGGGGAVTGVKVVTFSATPVFNGPDGAEFKLTLTGDVASSTFTNGLTGATIFGVRIVQDGTGGRNFTPPVNWRGFGAINPGPNARSLQLMAIDTDGSADAIGPIMYS